MKKKKTIILVLAFIALLAFLASATYTYAKYRSGIKGSVGSDIAKWNFVINDEYITSNHTGSLNIPLTSLDVCNSTDCKVTSGKIAPGSRSTFQIEIDYTDVTLDFNYTISITDSPIADLRVEIDGATGSGTEVNKDVIIDPTSTNKVETVNVNIEWKDDGAADETMDDAADTAIGSGDDLEANFTVSINLKQLRN